LLQSDISNIAFNIQRLQSRILQMIALYMALVYTKLMTQSTLFKNNKTQAVRLPKSVAFPDHVKKVDIIPQGNGLLIVPVATVGSWDDFFNGPRMDDDFMSDRNQPAPQEREL
jgi:antitoxin VapB